MRDAPGVLLLEPVAALVVLTPVIVMLAEGRGPRLAVALWLLTVACTLAYFMALDQAIDRDDATGEGGDPLAGLIPFVGACLAGAASVVVTRRSCQRGRA
jgi:hypothetical protein